MSSLAASPEPAEKLRRVPKEAIVASSIAFVFSAVYVDYYSLWGFDTYFVPLVLLGALLDGDLFNELAPVLFVMSRIVVPILLMAACLCRGKSRRRLAIGAFAVECIVSFLAFVVGHVAVPVSGIVGIVLSTAALAVVALSPVAKTKIPAFPIVALGMLVFLSVALVFIRLSPYGYIDLSDGHAGLLISSFIRNPAIWIAGAFLCMDMDTEPFDARAGAAVGSGVKAASVGDAAARVKSTKISSTKGQ